MDRRDFLKAGAAGRALSAVGNDSTGFADKGEKREDAFAKIKKTINIYGIEPHVYTESEYKRMREDIRKMIKGGIILFSS